MTSDKSNKEEITDQRIAALYKLQTILLEYMECTESVVSGKGTLNSRDYILRYARFENEAPDLIHKIGDYDLTHEWSMYCSAKGSEYVSIIAQLVNDSSKALKNMANRVSVLLSKVN